MGYTTEFNGRISIDPPLSEEEILFLNKFCNTRRMACMQGPYYIDREGFKGQERGDDIYDYNTPPHGQPGLWCQWAPTENGEFLEWDGGEKFYSSVEWMNYLIDHFLKNKSLAFYQLEFLQGHILNGEIYAEGEEESDKWKLVVKDNIVTRIDKE